MIQLLAAISAIGMGAALMLIIVISSKKPYDGFDVFGALIGMACMALGGLRVLWIAFLHNSCA